jgi:phage shock protein A
MKDRFAEVMEHMQDCLAAFKETTATAIARRQRIRRELETQRALAHRWARCGQVALSAGDPKRASRAFVQQLVHQEMVRELQAEDKRAVRAVEDLKASLQSLEVRLAKVKSRHGAMLDAGILTQGPAEISQAELLVAEFEDLEMYFRALVEECGNAVV